MFNQYYSGRRVLVTGHTGFKGGWLSLWLQSLGAHVWGISLPPPTTPNLYEIIPAGLLAGEVRCDIRHASELAVAVQEIKPEIVFHLAAQSLVRLSYSEPLDTFATNALGTAHLLQAVRTARLPAPVIVVTSDKCYENREWEFAYRENDPLGGHDVYSMSKAATELVAHSWNKSFFQPDPALGPIVTVRAGNVIGGGDYALDRIVPDSIRSLSENKPILVRNPGAVRPWQHVLECLSGYLWLGARLAGEGKNSRLATAFNFGPNASSRQPVRNLVGEILRHWPGQWVDASKPGTLHEASLLTLSIEKAGALLNWHPVWPFATTVEKTVTWYRKRQTPGADLFALTRRQIEEYAAEAHGQNLPWAQPA